MVACRRARGRAVASAGAARRRIAPKLRRPPRPAATHARRARRPCAPRAREAARCCAPQMTYLSLLRRSCWCSACATQVLVSVCAFWPLRARHAAVAHRCPHRARRLRARSQHGPLRRDCVAGKVRQVLHHRCVPTCGHDLSASLMRVSPHRELTTRRCGARLQAEA